MTTRLVDTTLFSGTDPLTLRGSRCTSCGTTTFPAQSGCPRCFRDDMVDETLPASGTVWSWTVQHFEPKSPFRPPAEGFAPYLLGYVDLGSVVVESRLTGSAEQPPAIGDAVSLVPFVAFTDDDGTDVVSFAFAPRTAEPSKERG